MWWSGVAVISALLRKNVWINRFSYVLYPNVYVLLISARSGLRKGLSVDYAKSIVEKLNCTRIISGRNSVQGVMKALSNQITLQDGPVINTAQAFLCAPELASFMIRDEGALTTLTDIYNTHEHESVWQNTLRNSPVESLRSPCITLLGASNEALFEDFVRGKDIEGGFIARTFVIFEKQRRSINSLMEKPKFLLSKTELAEKVKYILDAKGEFEITNNVRKLYDKWYHHVSKVNTDDRTGTLERIGDQALKLAMIVSLASSTELKITEENMQLAIDKCEEFYGGTQRVSMGQGKSELAPAVTKILKILIEAPENTVERQALLKRAWPDVDVMTFDKVVETIGETSGTGAVRAFRGSDKKVYYRLKPEYVEQYKKFKEAQ